MTWWHYLLLSNLYLVLFYGFYVLLLQRETFFQLNRVYLVGAALMSFLIPLIQLDWVKQWFITQKVQETIYTASPVMIYRIKAVQPQHITMGELLSNIYIAGIVILSLKLLWQLFTLSRVLKSGKQVAAAWSFFKKIEVDQQLDHHEVIVAHEEVHARQWHSADVLFIEVIMILNWFNPVVYFYRGAIKHIHEFIADRDALNAGTSKAEYALMLLSQTFDAPVHHLLNPFFGSSVLKQRIVMIQKNRSHYLALVKYGFSAPLFALMLALSSATINNSRVVKTIQKSAEHILGTKVPELVTIVSPTPVANLLTVQKPEQITAARPQFKINTDLIVNDEPHTMEPVALPAADSVANTAHNEVFTSTEKLPQYPGGIESFHQFLSTNLHYPAEALEKNVKGRVNITFIVERDGALSNFRAVGSFVAPLANEALRVMALSPKWLPGEQNGKRVAVQYTVPIVFTPNAANVDSSVTGKPHQIMFKSVVSNMKINGDSLQSASPKVNMMVISAKDDKRIPAKFIFLVDGKEMPREKALTSLNPNKIQSIAVFKTDPEHKTFGKVYDKDVIVIATKK